MDALSNKNNANCTKNHPTHSPKTFPKCSKKASPRRSEDCPVRFKTPQNVFEMNQIQSVVGH